MIWKTVNWEFEIDHKVSTSEFTDYRMRMWFKHGFMGYVSCKVQQGLGRVTVELDFDGDSTDEVPSAIICLDVRYDETDEGWVMDEETLRRDLSWHNLDEFASGIIWMLEECWRYAG